MPNYRRAHAPGGAFFFTLVTHGRRPIFQTPERVGLFREATRRVKRERPFEIVGAVVLPDHVHFLWTLPPGDADFSRRIARIKMEFTRSLGARSSRTLGESSRRDRRESDVWQRRFWEHTIRDERDFEQHLNYVHYNPVKHGHATCPHAWPFSSFCEWVHRGAYEAEWGCQCRRRDFKLPDAPAGAAEWDP